MVIFLIMSNDYPFEVWDTLAKAQKRANALNEGDAKEFAKENKFEGRNVYYKVYDFEVKK